MVLDNQFEKFMGKWPRYVKTKSFLFFSGQLGLHPKNSKLCLKHEDVENLGPAPNHSYPWVDSIEGPIASQSISAYESVSDVIKKEGGDLGHLVRFHLYQRDKRFFPIFDSIRKFYEPNDPTPSTAVGMGHFDPDEYIRFNIDGISMNPQAEKDLGKRTALPGSKEHSSAAHFSHVVGAGPDLFVAGQIPTDTTKPGSPLINSYYDIPEEGHILKVGRSHEDSRNGPIAVQTWFTYDLIRKHLEGSGSSLEQILNLTVYLQDMRDFPTFHRIHERFFPTKPPALTVLQVAEVGHKGERIEIEPTAITSDSKIQKEIITSGNDSLGAHMSLGTRAGDLVFLSNVTPSEGDKKDVLSQAESIVSQLKNTLSILDVDFSKIAHLTVFLKDINDLISLETLFDKIFPNDRPAFTALQIPLPSPNVEASVSMTAIVSLS